MLLAKRTPYRIGDVLTLKSGGHPMTATWVGPVAFASGTWLICQWFGDDGELRQEMFAEQTLARAPGAFAAKGAGTGHRWPPRLTRA